MRALVHVLTCEISKTYAFALTGPAEGQFGRMAEDYVQYHLGRGFESLRFYQTVLLPPETARRNKPPAL